MVNTTIVTMLIELNTDAPSAITVFCEQEAPKCHHPTYKHLILDLNHLKECSLTAPTCLLKHDAQGCHHNIGASSVITVFYEQEAPECHHHTYKNLIHNLLFKYEALECHHTVCNLIHNLLVKYEAPECHHTVCNLIHNLLFKHDTPERHHTMGSLIHHLHE